MYNLALRVKLSYVDFNPQSQPFVLSKSNELDVVNSH